MERLRLAAASTLPTPEEEEAWRLFVQEAFPEFRVSYDSLSCSIACHTGIGAVGVGLSVIQRPE
jgi:fatty acid-binding protein DegV